MITPGPNLLAPALSRALNDNSRTAELVPHRQPGTLPLSVATPEPVVRSQTQAAISLATHQHQGHNPRSVTIKTPSATPTSPPKDTLVRVAPSWIRLAAALVRQRLPLCVRTLRGAGGRRPPTNRCSQAESVTTSRHPFGYRQHSSLPTRQPAARGFLGKIGGSCRSYHIHNRML